MKGTAGDGLVAEFDFIVEAGAIQIWSGEGQGQVSPERRIVLRIGINPGDGGNLAVCLGQLCLPQAF